MKFKKFIATILVFGMLASGMAFASEETAPVMINGATVQSVEVVEVDGVQMMPLRLVAEGLGYTVNWNGENNSIDLIRGAQFITMQIGEDSYAFSRRAPQSLGMAPILYNDEFTYVPLNFITEIINGYYSQNEDATFKIVIPHSVTVSAVEENCLTVIDNINGEEVIVFVDENTEITDGVNSASFADIKNEMVLGFEYGEAMTMSLPPQTTAVKIIIEKVVIEEAVVNGLEFSGVITEIEGEKIVLGQPESDANAIALIISDETVITKGNDKRIYKLDDLTVGTKISGTRSEATTMSIPPQSVALTVNIEG